MGEALRVSVMHTQKIVLAKTKAVYLVDVVAVTAGQAGVLGRGLWHLQAARRFGPLAPHTRAGGVHGRVRQVVGHSDCSF